MTHDLTRAMWHYADVTVKRVVHKHTAGLLSGLLQALGSARAGDGRSAGELGCQEAHVVGARGGAEEGSMRGRAYLCGRKGRGAS